VVIPVARDLSAIIDAPLLMIAHDACGVRDDFEGVNAQSRPDGANGAVIRKKSVHARAALQS
jgi:hypothetical protein